MAIRDELHDLVDELDEAAADELLDSAYRLRQPTDAERAHVEAGEAEIRRGDYVTLEDLHRRLGSEV